MSSFCFSYFLDSSYFYTLRVLGLDICEKDRLICSGIHRLLQISIVQLTTTLTADMTKNTKLYPMAVVIPVLSFISILLCLPPLALHAKNRNFPAAALICWAILLSVFNIINAILWPTDDIPSWWDGAGLCDIEVKIMVASYVAVPAALTCIFRGLAAVLDTNRAVLVPSRTQRWRNRLVELVLCVFVPILAMATHYIYQKDRYLLYAISGCVNNYDESWPSFVLAWMWPPILCLISAYYCCKSSVSYSPQSRNKP